MKIKWVGEERESCYGVFKKDDIKDLPEEAANSFINQGLATKTRKTEYDKPKTRKRTETERPPVSEIKKEE